MAFQYDFFIKKYYTCCSLYMEIMPIKQTDTDTIAQCKMC